MNEKILSKRLKVVVSFLPEEPYFADIGSDHAYLPCYVCKADSKAKAIAGELNDGPFQSAKRNVHQFNLENQVEVRKGNGLSILNDEDKVKQIVIAGMGGSLITNILETGKRKLTSVDRIIVQPNVDAHAIRRWFYQNNYALINEQIICEDGHIYEVLVAEKGSGKAPYNSEVLGRQLLFGPFLMQERSPFFCEKWQIEKQRKIKAINQMNNAKILDYDKMNKFKQEVKWIEEVLSQNGSSE